MAKLPHIDARWLWVRCYLSDVQSTNDEDFQKFPLTYFCKVTLCGYSYLMSTSHDHIPPCMGIPTSFPPCVTSFPPHMWGENAHARWGMVMRGEDVYVRWKMVTRGGCKVRMPMQGGKRSCKVRIWSHKMDVRWECLYDVDARWEYPWEVKNGHARWMWGENVHDIQGAKWSCEVDTMWDCPCKVGNGHVRWTWGENAHMRQEMVTRGECKVRMPMKGQKWSHEVDMRWMWGENVHATWGGCKVRMSIQGGKWLYKVNTRWECPHEV